MRISTSARGTICSRDVTRVNSTIRQKENKHFFNAFISDCLDLLNNDKPCLVFNMEHIQELEKIIPIDYTYDSVNKWYTVTKKEEL